MSYLNKTPSVNLLKRVYVRLSDREKESRTGRALREEIDRRTASSEMPYHITVPTD